MPLIVIKTVVLTLLSVFLVGCGGGGSDSGADNASPQEPSPQEQSIKFAQVGPFSLVVDDTLSNVASGGQGTGVISYSSGDTTIATVDATGQLTVVGVGIATITAEKAADTNYTAASASYVVHTMPASQGIGFEQPGPLHLVVGDTLSNVASGGPGTGVISYSSNDTHIATVDATGQLTVVGVGTAAITAEKAADTHYTAASASYTAINAPSRVPMTAWVGSTDAQVNLPLSASGMLFFRSSEANCDLSNYASCAHGQMDIVTGQIMVTDTAFTLNQVGYYVLQHGVNQASLKVSAKRFRERSHHQVVAYDNWLWVIGGYGGALKNDVWYSQDGVTWTEATGSAGFSARYGHQVVAYNNRLWVIGGYADGAYKNDVWWSQDGVTWTEATGSAGFSARAGHQVVAHNNRLWVIGGDAEGTYKNDVWWLQDGVTWTEAAGSAGFSARAGHQVVAYNNRLWVIGGFDGGRKNDVWWSQDGVTWTEATGSAGFSARVRHRVVAYNNRLWVIGGYAGDGRKNDVWWSQDGVMWTEAARAGFSPRDSHQVVAYNNRLWVIGGDADDVYKNDVWCSTDTVNWRQGLNYVFQFR